MTSLSGLNLTALVTTRDFKNTCIYKLANACLYTFHRIGAWSFSQSLKAFSRISFFRSFRNFSALECFEKPHQSHENEKLEVDF